LPARWSVAVIAVVATALFAVSADAATVLPNSGLPGSTCVASSGGLAYGAPTDAGVTMTGLGADAPAYYEIGNPSGAFLGHAPKGLMIVIHGGGWYTVGPAAVAWNRDKANRWRETGWQTINIDYRACAQSIPDVLWFMQRIRLMRPRAVICATGVSAGGHLALMLASVRKDLACAIALAGPSDLGGMQNQLTFDKVTGLNTPTGSVQLFNVAVAAFGAKPSPLVFSSPTRYASNISARLLLASGVTDPLVSLTQNANFAIAMRAANPSAYVDVAALPTGPAAFVHTRVTQASLDDLRAREDALVAPLVA
jgi:acetyl esterase/lipase